MKGEDRVRHEESTLCQEAQHQALAGGPPTMGLDLRDPGDTKLAQQDARLQARELCCALGPLPHFILQTREHS